MSQFNRRKALTAAAALSALAVPAAAAVHVGPHPDADLFALWEELMAAYGTVWEISDRSSRAYDRHEARCIPKPDVCRPQEGDEEKLGDFSRESIGATGGYFGLREIEAFRNLAPERPGYVAIYAGPGELPQYHPVMRPNDLGRAREIVQAYDEWKAADDAIRGEAGYVNTDDEMNEATSASCEIENKIMRTPAKTFAGLLVKAKTALLFEGDRIDADYSQARQKYYADDNPDDTMDMKEALFYLAYDAIALLGDSGGRQPVKSTFL